MWILDEPYACVFSFGFGPSKMVFLWVSLQNRLKKGALRKGTPKSSWLVGDRSPCLHLQHLRALWLRVLFGARSQAADVSCSQLFGVCLKVRQPPNWIDWLLGSVRCPFNERPEQATLKRPIEIPLPGKGSVLSRIR